MTIRELHFAFDLGIDRMGTLSKENFNKAEKDWLLNEAALIFLKRRTSNRNNRKEGFEASQKRIDDLSTLVIKYPLQPAVTPTLDSVLNVYEVKLNQLSFPYYQLISINANVQVSTDCVKNVPLRLVQHDDYRTVLRDPFNNGSLDFIPFNFGRNEDNASSLFIYPNTLVITEVYPEYIKLPSRVSYGNYTYSDGIVYPAATLEFPEHTHQEIVDIAIEIAALNIENPDYIKLKTLKISEHE